jgi:hypothetical protein
MTQDEIIEMAVQAGMNREVLPLMRNLELLTDFAKLVAQHEREACAKVCDNLETASDAEFYGYEFAEAIRARGQA